MSSVKISLIAAAIVLAISLGLFISYVEKSEVRPGEETQTPLSESEMTVFKTFESIDKLMEYLREAASGSLYVYKSMGLPSPSDANILRVGAESLYVVTTNVQVEGIDEGDYVKVRREIIALCRGSKVYIVRYLPPELASVLSEITLPDDRYAIEVFILGESRLVVLAEYALQMTLTAEQAKTQPSKSEKTLIFIPPIRRPVTEVYVYDISDPSSPLLMWSYNFTGLPIASRSLGDKVYLVLQEPVFRIMVGWRDESDGILPLINGNYPEPNKVYYVEGKRYANPVVIAVIDSMSGESDYSVVLAPFVERVYMSKSHLYLFGTRYEWPYIWSDELIELIKPYLPAEYRSAIDKVRELTGVSESLKRQMTQLILEEALSSMNEKEIGLMLKAIDDRLSDMTVYIGPMTISIKMDLSELTPAAMNKFWGALLDQFAIHEDHRGNLMLALTAERVVSLFSQYVLGGVPSIYPRTESVNRVIICDSELKVIGALEGLAPGERVYSSRYIKDMLYLVTFRRVDPLFAINVSDVTRPVVIGYLKVPGFSEYLHPYNESVLIGVGLSEDGQVKVSAFDVSDPVELRELDSMEIGLHTPVLYDHKAFNFDPLTGRIAVPVSGKYGDMLVVLTLRDGKLEATNRYTHDGCNRAFFANEYVITVSLYMIRIWLGENMIGEVQIEPLFNQGRT